MNDYRILVVDDEEDLCEILKFNLENEGYEVDTANSAEEAMKMDISSYHYYLYHSKRYRKRYCDRIQPGSRRLYFKTFLAA